MRDSQKPTMVNYEPTSLYFHIPFCIHRCGYCDFNTYAGKNDLIPAYVEALRKEIKTVSNNIEGKLEVNTIFFGGGTPSLINYDQFSGLLKTIQQSFTINKNAEISLEANPGTVNIEYLKSLIELGFNRLSLGVQSTDPDELRLLERIHSREDIFGSVESARIAGFKNLNLDLIYGLPDQTIKTWKSSLLDVVKLKPEHLSLYALSIEKGTSFGLKVKKGLMNFPDPDLAADLYIWSSKELEKSGFQQYEISNWAKNGYECKHNLQIWHNRSYLGFGAGAHGYANNLRVSNVLRIKEYINRIANDNNLENGKIIRVFPLSPATISKTKISTRIKMQESLMLGLRLTHEGVSAKEFQKNYGESLMEKFGKEITALVNLNLLEWRNDSVRLTQRGRLLGNQVFLRFVD